MIRVVLLAPSAQLRPPARHSVFTAAATAASAAALTSPCASASSISSRQRAAQ